MNIRGAERMRRARRWLKLRLAPEAVILIYHRVVHLPSDPYLLAVAPERFAEHLEVLRQHYRPMRLDRLVAAWRKGRLPQRAVAVTIDDGYDDCLRHARPLLERYDIPATVFVVSGNVGGEREFWWDKLERLLLQPGDLPQRLRLEASGRSYNWDLGEAARYGEEEWNAHRGWHYEKEASPTARQRVFRELWLLLHSLSEEEREAALKDLFAWAGASAAPRPTHRSLTPDELIRLAAGGLVEVGAHTVTHPSLARLTADAQRRQVWQGKADLEEILGREIKGFSYPHGKRSDYTAETAAMVEQAGFDYACAAFAGAVGEGEDRFQLPRNPAWDCGGETFARWMRESFPI